MKKLLLFLVLLTLLSGAFAQRKPKSEPSSLIFSHVTVIDATGSQAKPDMSVVIVGDRIAEIVPSKKLRAPKEAQVVDATGKFMIPGLWDMHVHAFDRNLFSPLFIANGITGVRDMFSPLPAINQWRKEIREGTILGPHIIAAGPIVDGPKPIWPGSIAVSNVEEGIKAVNTVKQGGSDFVKVYSLLPRDAYFAIAAEAKRQGMVFAGHVPDSVTVAEASDAGQKSIEHLTGVLLGCSSKENEIRKDVDARRQAGASRTFTSSIRDQIAALDSFDNKKANELFARFAKNGTWMDPTLTVLRSIAYVGDSDFRNDPRLRYIPGYLRAGMWGGDPFGLKSRTADDNASAKRVFQKSLEIVGVMKRAGVQIIAGTDTPNPFVFPGFSLHDELGLLVKAGLTPMEALQAATRNAANYLGMLDSTGTIEKGKLADLVLLDDDPLADISNTKKIKAVVVGGKFVNRVMLDEMLAKVEAGNKN
jgi:Amidohydrolase family